jgi:hypothetical protein
MLQGYIDIVSTTEIHGWVADDQSADGRAHVEIFLGDELLGASWASLTRADLRSLGFANRGFHIILSQPLTFSEQLGRLRFEVNGQSWDTELTPDRPGVMLPFKLGPVYALHGGMVVEVVLRDPEWEGDWPIVQFRTSLPDALVEVRRTRRDAAEEHWARLTAPTERPCIGDLVSEGLVIARGVTLTQAAGAGVDPSRPKPNGMVDTLGPQFITGWMRDAGGESGQTYVVEIDGERVGSGLANRVREDVATAMGPDCAGFLFQYPSA